MANVFGIDVSDLDPQVTPIEVVVSLKGMDEDGHVSLYELHSDGLSCWEAIGMLTTHADGLRQSLLTSGDDDA